MNLQVHHQLFRSHSGDDSEENLSTVVGIGHRPGSTTLGT
jgi:hypothetical protein